MSLLRTYELDVSIGTDKPDVLLKTDETDIPFDMMIIELRLDLIPRRVRRQLVLEFSHDLLFPDIFMIFDLRMYSIFADPYLIISLCSKDIVAHILFLPQIELPITIKYFV